MGYHGAWPPPSLSSPKPRQPEWLNAQGLGQWLGLGREGVRQVLVDAGVVDGRGHPTREALHKCVACVWAKEAGTKVLWHHDRLQAIFFLAGVPANLREREHVRRAALAARRHLGEAMTSGDTQRAGLAPNPRQAMSRVPAVRWAAAGLERAARRAGDGRQGAFAAEVSRWLEGWGMDRQAVETAMGLAGPGPTVEAYRLGQALAPVTGGLREGPRL